MLTTFAGAYQAFGTGMPRVWILRADSNEHRDALAADLHRQFTRPPERLPDPRFFDDKLPSAPRAEQVGAITRGMVHIGGPRPKVPEPSTSIAEIVKQALEQRGEDPHDDDTFHEIDKPDGINLLRDDLEDQLRERWERDLDWL